MLRQLWNAYTRVSEALYCKYNTRVTDKVCSAPGGGGTKGCWNLQKLPSLLKRIPQNDRKWIINDRRDSWEVVDRGIGGS